MLMLTLGSHRPDRSVLGLALFMFMMKCEFSCQSLELISHLVQPVCLNNSEEDAAFLYPTNCRYFLLILFIHIFGRSIHQFTTASVARFSLAISRNEKNGDENSRTSAFMNVEAWRKNENTASFDRLVKGALLTVEGYFKPEEWQDAEGVKHNRVILVATKFYEAVEKENTSDSQQGKTQKDK